MKHTNYWTKHGLLKIFYFKTLKNNEHFEMVNITIWLGNYMGAEMHVFRRSSPLE